MATHTMLDLETLGTDVDPVILSIGAVKFDAKDILDRFHVAIDVQSCLDRKLTITGSTVMWWLDPERGAAREALLSNEIVSLDEALDGFTMWYGNESHPIWGNGATFDNIALRSAYAACGRPYPAKFYDDQCYRTMKYRAPEIEMERVGVHHSALDDAESQARHLQRICEHLGVTL